MLETCSDLMRRAYDYNWITVRDGNISQRWNGQNYFWITPSGIRKPNLQPDMWKKIDIETKNILEHTDVSKNLQPSGELPLHYELQRNIPEGHESRVVVHLHPTYTIAAMHRGIRLHKLVSEFPELGRYTRVAPTTDEVPPISEELGQACHENLGLDNNGNIEYNIVGIKGHGVVAIDETPWRAFEHIERLEHICKIILVSGV